MTAKLAPCELRECVAAERLPEEATTQQRFTAEDFDRVGAELYVMHDSATFERHDEGTLEDAMDMLRQAASDLRQPARAEVGELTREQTINSIVRDCCETEPASAEADGTICIDVDQLRLIVEHHIAAFAEGAEWITFKTKYTIAEFEKLADDYGVKNIRILPNGTAQYRTKVES